MASNEENLQLTTELTEKEDRPLKRKVDRQAQKIHELTAQISKLEAEAEKQAEELGSLQDERDDAQDETKQALHELDHWKRYVAYKRTEFKRLTDALKVSQDEVTQLRNEKQLREQTARVDGMKLCDALTAVYSARLSEDHALESLVHLFKDTGIYQAPTPDHSPSPTVATILLVKLPPPPACDQDPSPTVAAVPLIDPPPPPGSDGSNSSTPPPSPSTPKAPPPRLHYTISQLKAHNPITTTQRHHGPEVAAAVWKSHPSHKSPNPDCPPARPLPGSGGSSRLRLPIGTPPTSSFAPSLDTESRQLTQALANGSSPLAATMARVKAESLARGPRRPASNPVVVDGST